MLMSLLLAACGLVVLLVGGELLVRGAAALALRLGLTPLFVGLTVVAFGTSSPELAVSLKAALDGIGGLALGNVVGSNIANIALILGVAALIRPLSVEAKLVRIDMPIMLACSVLVTVLVLLNAGLGRLAGGVLALLLLGYVGFSIWEVRRERPEIQEEFASAAPVVNPRVPLQLLLIVVGLAGLGFGASLFVRGAVDIAVSLGVSAEVIGLTVVALGTSMPELATSAVASWRRQADIAVGNVVGSNIFNLLCVLGITALVIPVAAGEVGIIDMGVMVALALLLWIMTVRGVRVNRWEGGLLLALYILYIAWLVGWQA
ncbi:MAG: calcium/sodium antiporter [Gammaproteobacteria bacterium]|nr:calcium/sodium antiporter [Gammaproteobacteria bacterium]